MIRPATSTLIRSARLNTASMSCSMSRIGISWRSSPSSCTICSVPSIPIPAIGSSIRSARGSSISATATSSARRCPCERSAARVAAYSSSQIRSSIALPASTSAASRITSRTMLNTPPRRLSAASMQFCSAVISIANDETWKVRARPRRARATASSPVTSRPLNRTVPLSGGTVPAIWPMRVDFPAPFGPISAWISPGYSVSDTSSLTARPPKYLESARASRT